MAPWWVKKTRETTDAGRNSFHKRGCFRRDSYVLLCSMDFNNSLTKNWNTRVFQFFVRLLLKSIEQIEQLWSCHAPRIFGTEGCRHLLYPVADKYHLQFGPWRLAVGNNFACLPRERISDCQNLTHYTTFSTRQCICSYAHTGSRLSFAISALLNRVSLHLTDQPLIVCITTLNMILQTKMHLGWLNVDFQSSFKSVISLSLWLLLWSKGITEKILHLLKDLYSNTFSCVRMDGELYPRFETSSELWQGCVVAPDLLLESVDWSTNNAVGKG